MFLLNSSFLKVSIKLAFKLGIKSLLTVFKLIILFLFFLFIRLFNSISILLKINFDSLLGVNVFLKSNSYILFLLKFGDKYLLFLLPSFNGKFFDWKNFEKDILLISLTLFIFWLILGIWILLVLI